MTNDTKKMGIMLIVGVVVALVGVFIYQKMNEDKNTVSFTIDTANPSITIEKE